MQARSLRFHRVFSLSRGQTCSLLLEQGFSLCRVSRRAASPVGRRAGSVAAGVRPQPIVRGVFTKLCILLATELRRGLQATDPGGGGAEAARGSAVRLGSYAKLLPVFVAGPATALSLLVLSSRQMKSLKQAGQQRVGPPHRRRSGDSGLDLLAPTVNAGEASECQAFWVMRHGPWLNRPASASYSRVMFGTSGGTAGPPGRVASTTRSRGAGRAMARW